MRAIHEHENLLATDRETLRTYCKLFELDWRGDEHIHNRDEFLATHPVYLHSADRACQRVAIDRDQVVNKLKRACQPFVPEVAAKIMGAR